MLQEFVAEYVEINKVVPNIHFGGCGVFAEQLYDKLKLMGYKPRLVVFSDSVVGIRKKLKLNRNDFMLMKYTHPVIHICVKVDGVYLDSWGLTTSFENTRYSRYKKYEKLSITKLREINAFPIWNQAFKRANIKVITKRLDKIYKRISAKSLEVTK